MRGGIYNSYHKEWNKIEDNNKKVVNPEHQTAMLSISNSIAFLFHSKSNFISPHPLE